MLLKSPLWRRLLAGDVCSKKINTFLRFTSRLALIRVFTYHHAPSPGSVRSAMPCRWKRARSNLWLLSQPNICSPKQHSRRALHLPASQQHTGTAGKKGETISQAFTFGFNSQGAFGMHGWHPHFCPGIKSSLGSMLTSSGRRTLLGK